MDRSEFLVDKATPLMAAGALFFDEAGHVLLVEPTYKDYRDIPGGYVEQGESPLQACVRELREELDITPPIGRLLAMDWALGHGRRQDPLPVRRRSIGPGHLGPHRVQRR
ncbi:NUDIX hydrolase [Streptomyces sp. NPDC051320]|uniref:NUDIX hydrolase n=1 Tax=Streptomyces sp. NPDC051320 TaxID=3154644 RepID=UPI0034356BFB